jgi:hypothetical protein
MSATTIIYGAFSDYLEKALLGHVFGNTPYVRPVGIWAALFITAPTDAGPGIEPPTTAAYARVAVTFDVAPDATDGSSMAWNTTVLQFPTATGGWGTVQWVGLYDAATDGNMLAWGALSSLKVIGDGDAVRFGANQLMIGLQ